MDVDYDAELRLHHEVFRRAWGIRAGDHILDIGCGAGRTTRDAARESGDGSAAGVDISGAAVDRARALTAEERNVTFEQADAQTHPFPPDHFDLVISRFGTMFFADPVAAFTNIARALRPSGRLVMMVWQDGELNEWRVAIRRALAGSARSGGPNAFSLADPTTVTKILDTAGFTGITFADVHEPVYYGPDVDAALAWVRGFACTGEALNDPAVTGRLRDMLATHLRDDGVWLDSRAWVITARRR
ncbi:SAM-dependent methyltransferase [Actinoplanes lutulentus]|uniref:Ubiquinone/menaquinone biosynthesis C-methylase UbiE n=1 Tax=Actinoplanes lutulentus TaxID=1287878 RepID=A0A327ZLB7_9ACTN|nr:class I SAM-dependent methyltransferase [Actinoplanes lutulentus]MBB2941100.1 SAM-dependent methyltransferase [Actinoplanes lutulentus]RAK43409.1 ubiquinone/menaquinone biosynthesis C-methylase UbiE [Actinoplanes lutulentus]